jgi:hypothetical protein
MENDLMRCVTGWLCAGLLFSGSVFAEERLPGFLGEGSKAEIAVSDTEASQADFEQADAF